MKRREFMKTMGVGLGGLVGLERLVKAIAGDPAYAAQNCNGQTPNEHLCRNDYQCRPQGVHCRGNVSPGYNFECTGYECSSSFTCSDYGCLEALIPDFYCKAGFTCDNPQNGQRFDCQGSDPFGFGDQFNCRSTFTCKPGERFACTDFHCSGGFHYDDCAASAGTLGVAYVAPIQPN